MIRKQYSIIFIALMAAVVLSGCPAKDYVPCSIEITSPVKGSVLSPDAGPVTVTGRIVKGNADPWIFKINNKKAEFDKVTGAFTYTFQPSTATIFNTIVFNVTDKKLVSNTERVSYSVGQSMKVGDPGVVDNSLRIHMGQDLLDLVMGAVGDVLNSVTGPLIYGPVEGNELLAMLGITEPLLENPIHVSLNPAGAIYIDKDQPNPRWNGQINIGNISIVPDIVIGNKIMASVFITPAAGVDPDRDAALYIQGYHWTVLGNNHLALSLSGVEVRNAEISLYMNEEGMIGAKLDLTKGNVILSGMIFDYGLLEWRTIVLNALINVVINQYLMESLSISLDLMSVNDLSFDLMGIDLGIWPMNSSIITTTADDLDVDLGISAVYTGPDPVIPSLDTFYATPGDVLPALAKVEDENIMIAVGDDMMNQTMLALVQTGMLNDLNLDDLISGLLGSIIKEPAQMRVFLRTPPIMDLSGKKPGLLADKLTDLGRVLVRDMLIEVRLKAGIMPLVFRLNVDADAYLKLKIKDSGNIGITIDPLITDFDIRILYFNGINTSFLPAFGRLIFNAVLPPLLDSMLDIAPPAIDLIGKKITIQVVSTEAKDNYLVGRARIDVN